MKKLLLLMLSFFMALGAGLANASTRSDAMGATGFLNVVEDYDLIFTYPNKVLDYQNTVDYRIQGSATTDDWGGVLDGKNKNFGVLGVYLNRASMVQSFTGLVAANSKIKAGSNFATIKNPTPLVDLFWGKEISSMNIGVQVSYADEKGNNNTIAAAPAGTTTVEVKDFSRQIGIRAGAGLKDLGPFQEGNIAVGYTLASVENSSNTSGVTVGNWKAQGDGIHKLDVNANVRHDLDENNNLKLFAGFTAGQFGLKEYRTAAAGNETWTGKSSASTIVIGLGENHTVAEGAGLVSGGVRADIVSGKLKGTHATAAGVADVTNGDELKSSSLQLPIFVSTEAKVKNWLTLRAGVDYFIYTKATTKTPTTTGTSPTTTTTTVESYTTDANGTFAFNAGFGLNWKNWTLDGRLTTSNLETNLCDFTPGKGIFYAGTTGNLVLTSIDLRYKF